MAVGQVVRVLVALSSKWAGLPESVRARDLEDERI
jgi:hypothetical protein